MLVSSCQPASFWMNNRSHEHYEISIGQKNCERDYFLVNYLGFQFYICPQTTVTYCTFSRGEKYSLGFT